MLRSFACLLPLLASPALGAEDQLRTLVDPETGCTYFVRGELLLPRLRRDGRPDCPDVSRGGVSAAPDNRDLVRAIDRLQSEVQGLRREMETARQAFERRR